MSYWEHVDKQEMQQITQRMKVPGGWIVHRKDYHSNPTTAMVFVPDPGHEWDRGERRG